MADAHFSRSRRRRQSVAAPSAVSDQGEVRTVGRLAHSSERQSKHIVFEVN
jgi:hypothetical protein